MFIGRIDWLDKFDLSCEYFLDPGSKQKTKRHLDAEETGGKCWTSLDNGDHGSTEILTSLDGMLYSIRWHSVAAWVSSSEFRPSGRAEWQGSLGQKLIKNAHPGWVCCELWMFFSQVGRCGSRKHKTCMCFP